MKSMANNAHNKKQVQLIISELEKYLNSDEYGELILLIKLQSGVIQTSKLRKFNKEDKIFTT